MKKYIENVACGLRNMKTTPHHFLFFGEGQPDGEDWFDGKDILGLPVYNTPIELRHWVASDEDCPFFPIWQGEVLDEHQADIRIFQLSYARTGDFPE